MDIVIRNISVSQDSPLREAVEKLQASRLKLILVLNDYGKLVGTISDGDIRRALLREVSLADSASDAMNSEPFFVTEGTSLSSGNYPYSVVPVLNESGIPIGVISSDDHRPNLENLVVLMAGGKGTRLLPYTENLPKPLVEVGGQTLIEGLMRHFIRHGFKNFLIAVNHLAEQIMDRIGDGSNLGASVDYVRESKPLGTAGALGLIGGPLKSDIIIANADLITTCDIAAMLDFHQANDSNITIAMRQYLHEVPFGVLQLDGARVAHLSEKPIWSGMVSAGIYCVSPRTIDRLESDDYLDMTDLIGDELEKNPDKVSGFPMHETWSDVGRPEDLEELRRVAGS